MSEDKQFESFYNTATILDPNTPSNLEEALRGIKKEAWKKSAELEINNFMKRGSQEKVSREEDKSEGIKIIPYKWVFKIKHELDNMVRYKTKLCVKGFHEVPGVDYTESFSPVANTSTISTLLLTTLHM